jgi:hypothetical protein
MPRTLLRVSAWGMLLAIVLGYASIIPVVNQRLDVFRGSQAGRIVIGAILLLIACDACVLWLSAVWYASTAAGPRRLPRGLVVGLLLFTNFAGGFFYYFLVVGREQKRSETSLLKGGAVASRS